MESSMRAGKQDREPMSPIRKVYFARLFGRCVAFALCALMWLLRPEGFSVLYGMNFFKAFSPLHILWAVWVLDMACQVVPIRKKIALGSQKLFRQRFRPIREKVNREALRRHIVSTTRAAYKVMLLWSALGAAIGLLFFAGALDRRTLFLITAAFYVCDLVCVLIWCPFRLMMKNRCCTTCRIFNWDHLMMFTPMAFISSFYSWSLFLLSLVVWLVWELCVLLYPERFWEFSNAALKCSSCTDKLCTQYCRKLRR